MVSRRFADYAASSDPILKLPHPYLTAYFVAQGSDAGSFSLRQQEAAGAAIDGGRRPLPEQLHSASLTFTEPENLKSSDRPHESNNTLWGRARRSPAVAARWEGAQAPTLAQLWLVVYAIFTIRPGEEYFRLRLTGTGADALAEQLKAVLLAIDHPKASKDATDTPQELLVLRGTFWQGAGSPFGSRPVWVPEDQLTETKSVASYPLAPLEYTMTNDPSTALCWHPRRPSKPRPGSVIYSRYIPHLKENFSMVALDYHNKEHLELFHTWQNDPRVSQGWNETGTLEQHREYLRRADEDPHQMAILARFEDTYFAYFEVYWAKEDRLGAYYSPGDFDRGRHSLVGDVRFRGPHRVSAWWSSLMHYLFLDDPRTMFVVGEPKYTNSSVLMYDFINGFGLEKFVDLPHKRSAFVRCSRERFFQLSPLDENEKVVGGTALGLVPKL
ncbi:hypothetical protein GQ53DRAFT_667300 [Thozetella sp. PMI_491]|nr:hypothetical protein GQ53DRAFT_667300 [Thozetella sp. PMI_491]